jgi:hypothetical protein
MANPKIKTIHILYVYSWCLSQNLNLMLHKYRTNELPLQLTHLVQVSRSLETKGKEMKHAFDIEWRKVACWFHWMMGIYFSWVTLNLKFMN